MHQRTRSSQYHTQTQEHRDTLNITENLITLASILFRETFNRDSVQPTVCKVGEKVDDFYRAVKSQVCRHFRIENFFNTR